MSNKTKEIVSKRLLNSVLGIKNIFGEIKLQGNNIHYRYRYMCGTITNKSEDINIFQLANKCKKKAKSLHYYLNSDLSSCEVWKDLKEVYISEEYLKDEFAEPKSIFKSFEWILDNEKKLKESA